MSVTERSPPGRLAQGMLAGIAILVASFSVAICAAAPEFIWQGMLIALAQPHWLDLLSALLIGLNLVFFVEPGLKRLRDLLHRSELHEPATARPLDIFFTAGLGLAFALASVSLHDAMTAFIARHDPAQEFGLEDAVLLISAWAVVPFAVTLAWQSTGCRPLALLTGALAVASPFIAGWLFQWTALDVITTAIPCLLILGLGYGGIFRNLAATPPARHALVVGVVAAGWLIAVLLADTGLGLLGREDWRLYDARRHFVDLRFYLGWMAGLVLARFPAPR